MRHAWSGFGVLVLLVTSGPAASRCPYPDTGLFQVGRDEKGYFVRAKPAEGFSRVSAHAWVNPVVDYLAEAQRTTAFYFGEGMTEKALDANEWRGDDPLLTLKAFLHDAGLDLETPQPDVWVVGPSWFKEQGALSVFAQPLDPTRQGFLSAAQAGDMERALVAQLPIREGSGSPVVSRIGVSYYWLPKEGRDALLVLASLPPLLERRPPQYRAFKVQLDRSGGRTSVECVWAGDAPGRLVTDIEEDLDGDGYRDFVFEADTRDYGDANTVLSGKDGSTLLTFSYSELAVEKKAAGPKRIAVRQMPGREVGETPEAYSETYQYSPGQARYMPVSETGQQARALESAGPAGINTGWKRLARMAGGAENIRVYLLNRTPERLSGDVETVLVRRTTWTPEVTKELIDKGYPARILFTYESAGFLAHEREQEKLREQMSQRSK